MATKTLALEVKQEINSRRFNVELDAARFERLAALLNLFSPEFLESLSRAEKEISQGKVRRLRSLRDLRRK